MGDGDRSAQLPVDHDAANVLGRALLGVLESLHGGELHRLVIGDVAGRDVADHDLRRRQRRRHREGKHETDAVIAVTAST